MLRRCDVYDLKGVFCRTFYRTEQNSTLFSYAEHAIGVCSTAADVELVKVVELQITEGRQARDVFWNKAW